jgi:hypothetical protein
MFLLLAFLGMPALRVVLQRLTRSAPSAVALAGRAEIPAGRRVPRWLGIPLRASPLLIGLFTT